MDSSTIVKVTVKTLKQKEQFEVAQSSTIQEFKEEVAKRFKTRPDLLVLVFAGRVLKDQDTLSQHGIHSGVSIHVVISQEVVAQYMENLLSGMLSSDLDLNIINNNAFLLGFFLGVTGVPLIDLDSINMLDTMVDNIQEQDVFIYNLISKMLQSTSVHNILDNANLVRDLVMSHPQMQQLAEENPEICQILTDPNTIREILDACNSPAMLQEMIRNCDVAMSNLESIPGGHRALEQQFREIEETFLNAVQARLGNNPFASVGSNPPPSGAGLPAHTENRRPLPNPWAPPSDRVGHGGGDDDDEFAGSSAEFMFNLATALTNPHGPAQTLLSGARASSKGNSPPQDQWRQPLPPEMETAENSSLLTKPRALQALLQIQLGLRTLSREAPEFMSSVWDPNGELDEERMDYSEEDEESEEEAILMSDKDEAKGQVETDEEVPQTRFKRQMEQLSAMGFQDQRANLQALIEAEGDISAAVQILAKSPSSNKIP
ncbi:PREDICTED: ubiquilin-2-like [Tauraco erythrolophus]|uniref:ubiquilin-2-like n=1 Tax=Tauraco erythrolophus TaxID=121530 RepID=UPI0005236960|nr:PREDICTED: ubiquilin-2-like [Tauraco erythrolophus]